MNWAVRLRIPLLSALRGAAHLLHSLRPFPRAGWQRLRAFPQAVILAQGPTRRLCAARPGNAAAGLEARPCTELARPSLQTHGKSWLGRRICSAWGLSA